MSHTPRRTSFLGAALVGFREPDMGTTSSEKKRKLEEIPTDVSDRIEPQSLTPVMDTSKWPLLLKVCLHHMYANLTRVELRQVECAYGTLYAYTRWMQSP